MSGILAVEITFMVVVALIVLLFGHTVETLTKIVGSLCVIFETCMYVSPLSIMVTLSGLLNFVDGLWSSCGEERVIVFATNYKDRLDPALLRRGRMDMHIHMGYYTPAAFRILASNYHAVEDHPLFEEIEALIRDLEVTPAAIAEELMSSDDIDVALQGLVKSLQHMKLQVNNEAKPGGGGGGGGDRAAADPDHHAEQEEVDCTQTLTQQEG
ncbi:hypothetical protein J5N97_004173 [Dioscorea zingiberensis]|uniref:ATPase AAA-type core domain-containing protein n=1 Tax=Dioscorea zingiberensis TaxID=325984 RepID=A0A9D5HRV6_9LILI|nr:hypothetical protein J5N97_004173 [Dioscorea zingiberensis]